MTCSLFLSHQPRMVKGRFLGGLARPDFRGVHPHKLPRTTASAAPLPGRAPLEPLPLSTFNAHPAVAAATVAVAEREPAIEVEAEPEAARGQAGVKRKWKLSGDDRAGSAKKALEEHHGYVDMPDNYARLLQGARAFVNGNQRSCSQDALINGDHWLA